MKPKLLIITSLLLPLTTLIGAIAITWSTCVFPPSLTPDISLHKKVELLDRNGTRISTTKRNEGNFYSQISLADIPPIVIEALLIAEDKNFFEHGGSDWQALGNAIKANIKARRIVRGASTISEQVARLILKSPRSLWGRWQSLIGAYKLEHLYTKQHILEYYLNQVPLSRNTHGIQEGARALFDRDISTLSTKESLALAVLVRAPSLLDPTKPSLELESRIQNLGKRLVDSHLLSPAEFERLSSTPLITRSPSLSVEAPHFIRFVQDEILATSSLSPSKRIYTTLDGVLQTRMSNLLRARLEDLSHLHVSDGAALVVDHTSQEVLAWSSEHIPTDKNSLSKSDIDGVMTPRQPGSTLKPFLYALAFDKGWTAATVLEDSPLSRAAGNGLKSFRNFSGSYYGPVRAREALGNSLNIPAIQTISYVTPAAFYHSLKDLRFDSLTQPPEYYGEGLALGNGEVTLLELVRAYTMFPHYGVVKPLSYLLHTPTSENDSTPLISPASSSLVLDILSDSQARFREFGSTDLLQFPQATAVKTGTSTDYRDAWAVGVSGRYTVGIWMGNLTREPTKEITGSLGPVLTLRAIFAELEKRNPSRTLRLAKELGSYPICRVTGLLAGAHCEVISEKFTVSTAPQKLCDGAHTHSNQPDTFEEPKILLPTPGLRLAQDPRIPDSLEKFQFLLSPTDPAYRITWVVDGKESDSRSAGEKFLWPLQRGEHTVTARVYKDTSKSEFTETEAVRFYVR